MTTLQLLFKPAIGYAISSLPAKPLLMVVLLDCKLGGRLCVEQGRFETEGRCCEAIH
jgi:hypothetical protein